MGMRCGKETPLDEEDVKVVMHWMMILFEVLVENMRYGKLYTQKRIKFHDICRFKEQDWESFYADHSEYLHSVFQVLKQMQNVEIKKCNGELILTIVLKKMPSKGEKVAEPTEVGTNAVEQLTKQLEKFTMREKNDVVNFENGEERCRTGECETPENHGDRGEIIAPTAAKEQKSSELLGSEDVDIQNIQNIQPGKDKIDLASDGTKVVTCEETTELLEEEGGQTGSSHCTSPDSLKHHSSLEARIDPREVVDEAIVDGTTHSSDVFASPRKEKESISQSKDNSSDQREGTCSSDADVVEEKLPDPIENYFHSVVQSLKRDDPDVCADYGENELIEKYWNDCQGLLEDNSSERFSAEIKEIVEGLHYQDIPSREELSETDEEENEEQRIHQQRLSEQNEKNAEETRKVNEERERRKAELEETINEIRQKSRRRFAAFLQGIVLKQRFDEKENQWSEWINSSLKQPFIRIINKVSDLQSSLARETRNFTRISEESWDDIGKEVDRVAWQITVLTEIFSEIFTGLVRLSSEHLDTLFVFVLQKSICDVVKKAFDVLELLEVKDFSRTWFSKLEEVASSLRPSDIPTTGTLKYICQKASPTAYENLKFPERNHECFVKVEEVPAFTDTRNSEILGESRPRTLHSGTSEGLYHVYTDGSEFDLSLSDSKTSTENDDWEKEIEFSEYQITAGKAEQSTSCGYGEEKSTLFGAERKRSSSESKAQRPLENSIAIGRRAKSIESGFTQSKRLNFIHYTTSTKPLTTRCCEISCLERCSNNIELNDKKSSLHQKSTRSDERFLGGM